MLPMNPHLSAFFLLFLFSQLAFALPSVKVTLHVVDEAGVPIKGAHATVNFKAGTEGNSKTKRTNSKGMAALSGSSTRFIEYGAVKEDYYPTWYEKSYIEFTGMTGFRRWQPWNETLTLVLRKIINPTSIVYREPSG